MILKNHASAPIRKERLSPTSKAKREPSRNEPVEEGGMPESKAFEKSIVKRIVRELGPGLLNPFEIDSRKKSRQDSVMRLNSYNTEEVRETDRKKAGESISFPVLWMGIMEDVFQMEGKECKVQERLKM